MKSTPSWSARTASSTTLRITRGCGSTLPSSSTVTSPKVSSPSSTRSITDPNVQDWPPIAVSSSGRNPILGNLLSMDVTESNFEEAVLDRSHSLPVVVDFWAEWCAPCRQLGPVLEREVSKRSGRLELVKLDVDANQTLSRSYGIQGIPAVKAFHNGRVVAEFVGAQPATAVERFLDSLLPSEAELLAQRGEEEALRAALKLDSGLAAAAMPLARILLGRGQRSEALEILGNVHG